MIFKTIGLSDSFQTYRGFLIIILFSFVSNLIVIIEILHMIFISSASLLIIGASYDRSLCRKRYSG